MNKEIEIAKSKGFNDSDIDDLVAVNNIKSGKKRDFAKIMDKYHVLVLRKMLQYHNGDEGKAEDGASDVMVKILQNIDKWNVKSGKFKSWVYKITYTTFVDKYRKSSKISTVSIDALFRSDVGEGQTNTATFQIEDTELSADEMIDKKDSISKLKNAINQLSDIEKEIIELRYFSGMRFDVIADKIGLDENSCKVKIYRAKKKLKKLLE